MSDDEGGPGLLTIKVDYIYIHFGYILFLGGSLLAALNCEVDAVAAAMCSLLSILQRLVRFIFIFIGLTPWNFDPTLCYS